MSLTKTRVTDDRRLLITHLGAFIEYILRYDSFDRLCLCTWIISLTSLRAVNFRASGTLPMFRKYLKTYLFIRRFS